MGQIYCYEIPYSELAKINLKLTYGVESQKGPRGVTRMVGAAGAQVCMLICASSIHQKFSILHINFENLGAPQEFGPQCMHPRDGGLEDLY